MRLGDIVYVLFLSAVAVFLIFDETRSMFITATHNLPHVMGFVKFSILATSGELLSRRMNTGKWSFKGIHILSRAFIWGVIGLMISYIFKIFGAGVNHLISIGMLPVFPKYMLNGWMTKISSAFWMSLFTNVFFGFEMMTFHRVTDTLIEEDRLWKKWKIVETWKSIDWNSIFGFVLPSIFWFWLPMHTITFSLPSEYQVLMAAALGIALGIILSIAKSRSK